MIVTKKELADFFKVTTMTINRWEKKGLPAMRAHGGAPRYDTDAVIEWMGTNEKDDETKKGA